MCWENKTYIHPKTAKQDIPVFKIVSSSDRNGEYRPYYFSDMAIYIAGKRYAYKGVLYEDKKTSLLGDTVYRIRFGFHSYNPHKVRLVLDRHKWYVVTIPERTNTPEKWLDWLDWIYPYDFGLSIMNCIIPAGATYYENDYGEIVSDEIEVKYFEPLNPKLKNKYVLENL